MRGLLESEGSEAVILVDASNAFNSLNREVALRNVRILWPILAAILLKTYHQPSRLFIDGEHIWSQEDTTQGDSLAMAMYAIGTLPLIHRLQLHRSGMVMMHLLEAVSLACVGGEIYYSQVFHCLDIIQTPARLA